MRARARHTNEASMTLREHLEAILAHNSPPFPDGRPSMMFNREHAVAALVILDASNAVNQEKIPVGVPTPGRYRLVCDPTSDDEPLTREQRWAEAIIEGRYPEPSA